MKNLILTNRFSRNLIDKRNWLYWNNNRKKIKIIRKDARKTKKDNSFCNGNLCLKDRYNWIAIYTINDITTDIKRVTSILSTS